MPELISIGRSGLLAYRNALAGVSENVVNANTDGFAKRQVTLKEQFANPGPITGYRNAVIFNGVQGAEVSRVWDRYQATNAWSANSDDAMAGARSEWLGTIEQTLNDGDSGVGVKLSAIFTSATTLSADPANITLRQNLLYAVGEGAGAITKTEGNLQKVADTLGSQATSLAIETNNALQALGRVNVSLKASEPGTNGRAALEDQRDTLIEKIGSAVGVDVQFDSFGAVTMRLNDSGGPTLLTSDINMPGAINIQVAADGRIATTVTHGGESSAATVTSGKLAGMAAAAGLTADRRTQLNGLANDLATKLNTWQAAGKNLAGTAGAKLLDGTTAATLSLVMTDPKGIAASDGATANGNLVNLQSLRGNDGMEANWRAIVADQALRVQSAETEAKTASARKDGAYTAMDSVQGVDLDEEAANLMRFQQAYSASAKIIQAARQMTQDILALF